MPSPPQQSPNPRRGYALDARGQSQRAAELVLP